MINIKKCLNLPYKFYFNQILLTIIAFQLLNYLKFFIIKAFLFFNVNYHIYLLNYKVCFIFSYIQKLHLINFILIYFNSKFFLIILVVYFKFFHLIYLLYLLIFIFPILNFPVLFFINLCFILFLFSSYYHFSFFNFIFL
jgi:hypothetical protein